MSTSPQQPQQPVRTVPDSVRGASREDYLLPPVHRPRRAEGRHRVMIVAETYPPDINGSAQFSHRLAREMDRRGHEVHIVAPRPGPGSTIRRMDGGITEHRFRSHTASTYTTFHLCFPWEIGREVERMLDDVQPDIVHIECHYILGRALAKAAQRRGIRLIGTNHFIPQNIEQHLPVPYLVRRVYREFSWRDMASVFRRCDVVTAPTPLAVEGMRAKGFDFPVHALSNGIDAQAYAARPGEEIPRRDRPTVLFVGRLDPEKHVDQLIRAVAALGADSPAVLEIVGQGGAYDRLQSLADQLGVSERVVFRGFVDDDELRLIYLAADVFCQPGTAELQSLVTLEAMAASTPVVLAEAGALPHLVREGENGWLFAPGDHEQLADRLRRVLSASPAQRERMALVSRRMAEGHSFQATATAFEALYDGADPAELLRDWPRTGQLPTVPGPETR